jgi:ferredoxin-NADP reductase
MLQLKVEKIKWELPDTATFIFSELNGKKVSYQAGQFLTLVFDHHREEIRRSYSLCSSPGEKQLAITIQRITNGEISRFMLAKIKPGSIINAVEPAGRFTLTENGSINNRIFFAAGSGIVPIFSQLKYALSHRGKIRLTLIYSSRDAASVLFDEELKSLASKHPERLNIINLLSIETNRVNNIKVEQFVNQIIKQDTGGTEFYLCGPFEYMRMIRLTLLYMGFEPAQIRKENFVVETVVVPTTPANYPPRNIKIEFNNETYDLVVGENQSILQAALQNNIKLPYSCRNGICSACTAICKSGRIEMVKNDVLTPEDLAERLILTCTGHPVNDDVVIGY